MAELTFVQIWCVPPWDCGVAGGRRQIMKMSCPDIRWVTRKMARNAWNEWWRREKWLYEAAGNVRGLDSGGFHNHAQIACPTRQNRSLFLVTATHRHSEEKLLLARAIAHARSTLCPGCWWSLWSCKCNLGQFLKDLVPAKQKYAHMQERQFSEIQQVGNHVASVVLCK